MGDNVFWMLEVSVKPGQADVFKALMNEMVEATQANEPDALNYEWCFSDDGAICHLYERYADSAATMTHLASFGANFADRFLAAVEPTRFTVYGNPSAEVREALGAFGPAYMTPAAGFAR